MKKLICAMVVIALLLACAGGAALAESDADARQFMDASVKERTNDWEYTPIRRNTTVEAENRLAFTLIGVNYYQTLNTLILLRAELEIGLTEKAQAEGARGYTFNDLEFVLYGWDGAEETLHYLSRAYVLDGDLAQEVVLPISIPDEGTVRVVLEYLLPNATRTLCLIDTNLLGGSNGIYQAMGNVYAYVTHRTPNDFYLFCHSDKAVVQAYARPSGETDWTDNLLDEPLPNGDSQYISFVGTAYEQADEGLWELKFVLEDGTVSQYEGVGLTDIVDMRFSPREDEEGRYAISW